MASVIGRGRRYNTARSKRRLTVLPSAPEAGGDAAIVSATPAMAVLTLVFDRPVVLQASPSGILTDVAVDEISAEQTGPDTIQITYSGSVAAATAVILPNPLNTVRTATGGFARSLTFPV